MDSKHLVQIVGVNTLDYKSKKTGQDGQMKFAQCVITSKTEDKGEQIIVGELLLPKHLEDTQPGSYLAEFELNVGMDKRVGARLARLHPVNAKPQAVAASARSSDKG